MGGSDWIEKRTMGKKTKYLKQALSSLYYLKFKSTEGTLLAPHFSQIKVVNPPNKAVYELWYDDQLLMEISAKDVAEYAYKLEQDQPHNQPLKSDEQVYTHTVYDPLTPPGPGTIGAIHETAKQFWTSSIPYSEGKPLYKSKSILKPEKTPKTLYDLYPKENLCPRYQERVKLETEQKKKANFSFWQEMLKDLDKGVDLEKQSKLEYMGWDGAKTEPLK